MEISSENNLKKTAKIALVILLLSVLGQFVTFYQTSYQLVSPLIPEGTILTIVKPYIFIGLISTIVSIIALLLYFFEKYLLVVIVCGVAIIWQQVHPYLTTS